MIKNNKGFNITFILILAIIFFMMFTQGLRSTDNTYTMGTLMKDLEAGNVVSATIQPNEVAPTGSAKLLLQGGEYKTLYVTDTQELQELLREYDLDPVVKDIPRESWLSAYGIPFLFAV